MTTSQSRTLACLIALFCVATLLSLSVASADTAPVKRTYTDNPRVLIETTQGNIELELLPKFAPKHVDNFLNLVEQEFYPGLVFHRVIPGFMIQAGGYDADINYREHEEITVPNESFTVRMASVDASSSQLQSTVTGIRIVRTSFASSEDEQFAVSNETMPLASLSVLQVSPCCHLKVGFSPRELFNETVTSVTKLTSSPCATLTIRFRAIPSGAAIPPSKTALIACVFIL